MAELDTVIASLNAKRAAQKAIEDDAAKKKEDAARLEKEALQVAAEEWAPIRVKLVSKCALINEQLKSADIKLRVTVDIESPQANIARKETVSFANESRNIDKEHKIAFTVLADGHTAAVISRGYMRGQNVEFRFRTSEIGALELDQVFSKFLEGAAA